MVLIGKLTEQKLKDTIISITKDTLGLNTLKNILLFFYSENGKSSTKTNIPFPLILLLLYFVMFLWNPSVCSLFISSWLDGKYRDKDLKCISKTFDRKFHRVLKSSLSMPYHQWPNIFQDSQQIGKPIIMILFCHTKQVEYLILENSRIWGHTHEDSFLKIAYIGNVPERPKCSFHKLDKNYLSDQV